MALQPQIVKLVEKLTELTSQNKIAWETTAEEDRFITSAGKSLVAIAGRGTGEDADYRIQVLNDAGLVVEEAGTTAGDHGGFSPREIIELTMERRLLGSLHELARRNALHAAEAVADLLLSLEQIR